MRTKMKIAAGILAGLVVGATLVGTAVAAPRMMANTAFSPYSMMRSYETSGTSTGPGIADMLSFMDGYRNSDGPIDFNRMHNDVTSGKVTPPCFSSSKGAKGTSKPQTGQSSLRPGPSMMGGWTSNGGSTGYGMMGRLY